MKYYTLSTTMTKQPKPVEKKSGFIMEGRLLCLAPSYRLKPSGITAPTEGNLSGLAQAVIYGQAIINSSID